MRSILVLFIVIFSPLHGFDKVVIWGHKLHSHTHSYIHNAFYHAFIHMGFKTYWFDDNDDVQDFDFTNTFFLSEGQVDGNIPLKSDCIYCIHNPESDKYVALPKYFKIQVYNYTVHQVPNIVRVNPYIYYDFEGKCVYMPWATDLLPHEIEANKKKLETTPIDNYCIWVGTIGGGKFGNIQELTPFIEACQEHHIPLIHKINISVEENSDLTRKALIAPTIVGTWQAQVGYIPCRIFKNISYGKAGITNSKVVYELFEEKIVYNPDTHQLFFDAMARLENITPEEIYEQMDFVKNNHTYINRIQTLLNFCEQLCFEK